MDDKCDDHDLTSDDESYQDFPKTDRKREKFNIHNIKSKIDNQRTSVIKKIEKLPIIHKHNKEALLKMAINHKIVDIIKIMKSTESILTLHGKINLSRREFSEITKSDDAVIKVKLNGDFHTCDMIAYSRRQPNEEKKILGTFKSTSYDLNQDYTCEKFVMLREKNVLIMQMFNGAKTLKQIIEENPLKIGEIYKEILTLLWDLRYQCDSYIWTDQVDPTKKTIYFNQKWHIISFFVDHYECSSKSHVAENISNLIEFFKINGLSQLELKNTFKNIFNASVGRYPYYEIYCFIMEKHFKEPEDKKFASLYFKKAFQNSTSKRMRSKKT